MSTADSSLWLVERTVWLVVQAESTWTAAHRVQGQDLRPILTARGMHQARRCGRILAREPIAAVFTSDLRRDVQTARPVARASGVAVAEDPRLRERALGDAEGTASRLLPAALSGVDQGQVVDADTAPPGGESIRDLYRRVTRFVADLGGDDLGGDVVLVAHGSVVALIVAWLDGTGPDGMPWLPMGAGLVVRRTVPVPAASLPGQLDLVPVA